MKKAAAILILGAALALAGYCAVYFMRTASHREMLTSPAPQLAWLKHEFSLSEPEFARIRELHEAYLPRCEQMCQRIAGKNAELRELLKSSTKVTPEIQQKLAEAGALRADCQKAMLQHFFQVSESMPPAQGKRYLDWIREKMFLSQGGMMHDTASAGQSHDSHGH